MPKSVKIFGALIALSFSITGIARAQGTLGAERQALDLITNTADRICNVVETNGSAQNSEVQGDVRAELNGLASRLGNAGISGTGRITSNEYRGVLQTELAATLGRNADCKFKVFESLKGVLLNPETDEIGVKPEPTIKRDTPVFTPH